MKGGAKGISYQTLTHPVNSSSPFLPLTTSSSTYPVPFSTLPYSLSHHWGPSTWGCVHRTQQGGCTGHIKQVVLLLQLLLLILILITLPKKKHYNKHHILLYILILIGLLVVNAIPPRSQSSHWLTVIFGTCKDGIGSWILAWVCEPPPTVQTNGESVTLIVIEPSPLVLLLA